MLAAFKARLPPRRRTSYNERREETTFPSADLLAANRQAIYRSRILPGLWIEGPALLARDFTQLAAVQHQGLASREHAAFVKRLVRIRRKPTSS